MGIIIAPYLPQELLAESSAASSVEQRSFNPIASQVGRLSRFGISLDTLAFNGAVIDLKPPVEFDLFMEDDLWNCQSEALSILAFGTTVEEAIKSFSEDFLTVWDVIAQSPDEDLTLEAQRVKNAMRKLVVSVTRR
jgi:hypothetical protein